MSKAYKFILILMAFWMVCSCRNASTNNDTITGDTTISPSHKSLRSLIFPGKENDEDTMVEIKFPEFWLVLKRVFVCSVTDETQKDTVFIYPYKGATIEGQSISILAKQLKNITVCQRYETSASILVDCQCDTTVALREGCACELNDWKHYYSDWKDLVINNSGQFICDKYSKEEREKFPAVPISELKTKVKEHCGIDCYYLISKIASPTEYPFGVSISRYFIRISGQRIDNRKTVTKLILVGSPVNENYVLSN